MEGFKIAIEEATTQNKNFRKVLYTTKHSQLVLMTLQPLEEIGLETHDDNDQFFRFESGRGKCIVNGREYLVRDGDSVTVPAGVQHNVINIDENKPLTLYTIYSPPHHKDGTVHATKKEAMDNEEAFDGITTEEVNLIK